MCEVNLINLIKLSFDNYQRWIDKEFMNSIYNDGTITLDTLNKQLSIIKNNMYDAAMSCNGESALLLWESVVDHWHQLAWCYDDAPDTFIALYEAVDELRNNNQLLTQG